MLTTKSVREIPAVVAERFRAAEVCSTWGVFPELRHAWATVDNSLFLWSLDAGYDAPVEYSGEDQAIYAVGLAKAKPGVFMDAIRYLLVLCTPVEIVLLGVCIDGTTSQLALQPLPLYTMPSDAVCMAAVAATPSGRIFAGGRDGQLYEIVYSAAASWRERRCQKLAVSGLLGRLVPSVLKLWPADPASLALAQVVVDPDRALLYTRSKGSVLTVYDLGVDGCAAARRVAEFRGASAGGGGKALTHMAVVSPSESSHLHLVAVATDGTRLYLTTASSYNRYAAAPAVSALRPGHTSGKGAGGVVAVGPRPTTLTLVHTRAPPAAAAPAWLAPTFPGFGLGMDGTPGGAPLPTPSLATPSHTLKVECAWYARGLMVLADSHVPEPTTTLLVSDRDLMHLAHDPPQRGLREVVASQSVAGHVLAVAELRDDHQNGDGNINGGNAGGDKARTSVAARGELATQHSHSARMLVVVSSEGVLTLSKARPVDCLAQLLEAGLREPLTSFFKSYGQSEAAAMCLMLATSSQPCAATAAAAYEDVGLVGEPWVDDELARPQLALGGMPDENAVPFGAANTNPNYAYAVRVREVHFSGAHQGLVLYASRLLAPVWATPMAEASPSKSPTAPLSCAFSASNLRTLEGHVRALHRFVAVRRRGGHAGGGNGGGNGVGGVEEQARWGSLGAHANTPHTVGYSGLSTPGLLYSGLPVSRMRMELHKTRRVDYYYLQEARSFQALGELLHLSAQALMLLRVLCDRGFGRATAQLPPATRQTLTRTSLRDLVATTAGQQTAKALVDCVMAAAAMDAGDAANELSTQLSGGCPAFFGEDKRLFFAASTALHHATPRFGSQGGASVVVDDAAAAAARPAAAASLEQFMRWAALGKRTTALADDLSDLATVTAEFATLRYWEGVVALPLAYAAAADPLNHGDPAVAAAAGALSAQPLLCELRSSCYAAVSDSLRRLVARGGGGVGVTPADQVADQRALLRLALASTDRLFLEHMYRAMLELGLDEELLQLGGAALERFLAAEGAADAPADAPLTSQQASCLGLLVQAYQRTGQHARAAAVLLRLAEQRPAEGAEVVDLEARIHLLDQAALQARAQPLAQGGELVNHIQLKQTLVGLQRTLWERLRQRAAAAAETDSDAAAAAALTAAAESLRTDLKSLEELYNVYAQVHELWDVCLRLLDFSAYAAADAEQLILSLWDRYLDPAHQAASVRTVAGPRPSAAAVLEEAARRAAETGAALYPGRTFPLAHVAGRLELLAAGLWPDGGSAVSGGGAAGAGATGAGVVARALVAACHGAAERVLQAYNALLAQHGAMASPHVKLQLLRSVHAALEECAASAAADSSTDAPRQLHALAERCRVYKTLVPPLQVAPEAKRTLETSFDQLRARLLPAASNLPY